MLAGEKKRKYFQEQIETPLHKLGFRGSSAEAVTKEFHRWLGHIAHETVIPKAFYDFETTIDRIAAKETCRRTKSK